MALLTKDIRTSISKSVLCWLATVSAEGKPNVSPKEAWTDFGDKIIIANIASPGSERNIRVNPAVCISFVDILVQKGWQLSGSARVIDADGQEYLEYHTSLIAMIGERYPIRSIFEVEVRSAKPILAPSYFLYPETTTETSQIEAARRTYGL